MKLHQLLKTLIEIAKTHGDLDITLGDVDEDGSLLFNDEISCVVCTVMMKEEDTEPSDLIVIAPNPLIDYMDKLVSKQSESTEPESPKRILKDDLN